MSQRILYGVLLMLACAFSPITQAALSSQQAGFAFAGQEIDASTLDAAPKALSLKGVISNKPRDTIVDAAVYHVDGIAVKKAKAKVSADFGYGDDGRLSFVTITAPKKVAAALFSEIAEGAEPLNGSAFIKAKGNGRVELVDAKDASVHSQILIETTKVHSARQHTEPSANHHLWWVAGGVLGFFVLFFIARRGISKWVVDHQLGVADSVVAAVTLVVIGVLMLGKDAAVSFAANWFGAFIVFGYWRLLAWAIGATRSCGWIPGGKIWHSPLALVAAPILLIPAVVRKASQSFEYAGLVFFQMELLGILLYFYPNFPLLMIPALFGAFAAGVVRLFVGTFQSINGLTFARRKWVALILTYLAWPITIVSTLFQAAMTCLLMLLTGWWLILIGFFIGAFLDEAVLGGAIVAGILSIPALLGIGASSFLPTGFGNAGYSDGFGGSIDGMSFDNGFSNFDINPANGMPMIGGMGGIDIHGNSFGTNFNDSF